jgi:hypothetical protein
MLPILGIFIALLGAPAAGTNPSHVFTVQLVTSISGHVSDNSRNPIPDLQVELLDDVESVIARTKTDNSGLFPSADSALEFFRSEFRPTEQPSLAKPNESSLNVGVLSSRLSLFW